MPKASRSASRCSSWVAPTVWVGLLVVAVLTGCEKEHPQTTLDPASEFARAIDDLFMLTVWLGAGVFVIVEALLLYIIFRFRRRPGTETVPEPVHGHTRLEIAWTIAPAIILVFIAVPTVRTIFLTQAEKPVPNALNVRVTAHQWWWEFEYPDLDIVTANELHAPVGKTVNLALTSGDVIHSFWVPRLGGKRDVHPFHKMVPGQHSPVRFSRLWFTPEAPGTYPGQCAEFCGRSHAHMGLRVIAETEEDFAAWVANQQRPAASFPVGAAAAPGATRAAADTAAAASATPGGNGGERPPPQEPAATPDDSVARTFAAVGDPARGAQLFARSACIACHTIEGTTAKGRIGPNLTHFGGRQMIAAELMANTPENLARWLRDPPAVKPGALMPPLNLKEDQIADLVAYLHSLK